MTDENIKLVMNKNKNIEKTCPMNKNKNIKIIKKNTEKI